MAKEICISTTPHETRLAIVEDDQLTEIYYERENEYTLAGSIYKGKVTRVLPGMQSAFVDLGLERDAFLYVTDFLEEQEDSEEFAETQQGDSRKERSDGKERPEGGRGGRRGGGGRGPDRGTDRTQERPAAAAQRAEPSGSAAAEAEGEPGEPEGQGEEFQQGTRRWRGRRGRRRGVRGQVAGQASGLDAEAAAEQGDGERGRYTPVSIEAGSESSPERAALESPRGESRRGGRAERGRSQQGSAAITLPGEALQKYGQQPPSSELQITPLAEAPQVYQPHVTVRPSTLVEHPIVWDGVSAALPGETLSRHRGQPASRSDANPRVEEQQAPELHASSREASSETSLGETVPIDSAFPPAHEEPPNAAEEEPAPLVLEEEDLNLQEEAEFEPDASASHRVDPSSPSEFRLSSLFGREPEASEKREPEAAPVQTAAMEPVQAESAEISEPQAESFHEAVSAADAVEQSAAPEQPAYDGNTVNEGNAETRREQSHEAAALDHLHAFTPGDGQVEEEEIDEEEYDFAPLPEHAVAHDDEHDLSDLVEEETQASAGAEFGEVIRDAQIDRQVISSDDDDFEDSDEEEGVEEEGEPATATASEEGAPAPRRGRADRQRGRERERRGGRGRNGRRQSSQMSDLPIISELLKQGQEILVQIAKEPIAKKGARITSHIALPGRFLVFMPTVNHVGVSRKIWSDEERQRLKRILISEKGEASGGFIVRTAAENASEEELRADLRFLISLWNEIKQRSDAAKAPALIYHDLNLVERILRDQVSDNFSTIWVDSEAEYERIVRFLNRFQPSLVRRVKLYTKETPLFEQFGIQDEITKALKSKVWLKSGGSIVINQTEALVAIDINTGKYVGKTARLEDTILKTNLDAIPEIVRQIRLRDLGGIIVIDFIDMDERKNRHKVMAALEEELKSDRAPSKVLQFNDFGLVAITRKRVKQSLERTLSVQCNICSGTGMVKGPTTVANEIYIEMRKMQKHFERHDVMLRVNPEVVKTLKGNNARWLNDLEEMTGRTIIVKSDPALHPEQFDIH
ncbi:MAG TPA: Rne/Rng family ribonuclease [Acidobacteriaceae bacterium]